MAKLKDKVQNALDEGRMLVLGAQILVGFEYRSAFEQGFEKLPHSAQLLKMISLGIMLISIALIMSPSAYHRIVEEGEDTEELHRFTTRVMSYALLPFAVGLGLDFYVALEKMSGWTVSVGVGLIAAATAIFFWYGLETIRRQERRPVIEEEKMKEKVKGDARNGDTKIKDKIKHVLTEARTVLPGAQALLGFQFIGMLSEGFDKLPASSKYIHIACLALVALCVILLMTPAAYHRIVEEGEETEHFHRFASRIIIAAMVPLALGLSGDFFVVLRKVTGTIKASAVISGLMLVFFYGLWFGFTLYRRTQRLPSNAPQTASS